MSSLTPDAIRAAKAHLYQYGLRTDGRYGQRDQPCCAIGHIAVALGELKDIPVLVDVGIHHLVEDAFREWDPCAVPWITGWNDGLLWRDGLSESEAVDKVAAFYDWLEGRFGRERKAER